MNNESMGDVTVSSHGQKGEGRGGEVGIIEKSNPDVGKDMPIANASLSQKSIFRGEKDSGTKEWKEEG